MPKGDCLVKVTGTDKSAENGDGLAEVFHAGRTLEIFWRESLEVVTNLVVGLDLVGTFEPVVGVCADDGMQIVGIRRAVPPKQPPLFEILQGGIELHSDLSAQRFGQ